MTGPSHFGATASQGEFQADWDPGLQDNARKIQHKASRHNQGACTEIRRRETGRLRAIASLIRGLPVVAGLSSVVAIKCFDGAAGLSRPRARAFAFSPVRPRQTRAPRGRRAASVSVLSDLPPLRFGVRRGFARPSRDLPPRSASSRQTRCDPGFPPARRLAPVRAARVTGWRGLRFPVRTAGSPQSGRLYRPWYRRSARAQEPQPRAPRRVDEVKCSKIP